MVIVEGRITSEIEVDVWRLWWVRGAETLAEVRAEGDGGGRKGIRGRTGQRSDRDLVWAAVKLSGTRRE